MSTFEYLAALVSVVVGLGVAQALRGVGHLVHSRASVRIHRPHLLWLVNVVLWLIVFWWFSFGLADLPQWRFSDLLWVLFYAAGIYFLVALLLPDPLPHDFDPEVHFHKSRPWFFGALFCVGLIELADYWVKTFYQGVLGGFSGYQVVLYLAFLTVWLAGSLIARRVSSERFHMAFATTFLLLEAAFAVIKNGAW